MLLTHSLRRARPVKGAIRTAALLTGLAIVFVAALGGLGGAPATAAAAPTAVLSIDKSTVATNVQPGDTFVWEIQIGCESLETICIDAAMHDMVPAQFTVQDIRFVGVDQTPTVTKGAYDSKTGTPITVAFNETSPRFAGIHGIQDGQKLSVLVTVLLPLSTPATADGSQVTNTATVGADNAATQSSSSSVTLKVPATIGVDLTKKWATTNQIADPTATNTLTLTAQNTSNIAAKSITVVDPKAGTTNPFDDVAFTGFGTSSLPAGADTVTVTVLTGGTSTTGPPSTTFAVPTLPSGKTLADVTGFSFLFDSASGEHIAPFGTAATIVIKVVQRASVPTGSTTVVANTAIATVATSRGTGTDDASASFTIGALTTAVSAAKSFATSPVLAGASSVVTVTGTNTSNAPLSSLTITEPAASLAVNPFAADLTFTGFGKNGDGSTTSGGGWPTGATAATVTYRYSDASTSSATLASGATTGWPKPTAAKRVTGFTVVYTGAIAVGAAAKIPFLVGTVSSTAASVLNRVQVDGVGAAGAATPATADATLAVQQPFMTSSITKALTAGSNVAGQEIVATLTGKVTDENVPVRQVVLEDSPNSGSTGATFWSAFAANRVTTTVVPTDSTLTVQVTTNGTTWTAVGGPYAAGATVALDLSGTNAKGVRFVYDATGTTFFAKNATFAAKLVFTLTAKQAATALTWKNCATASLTGDNSLAGTPSSTCASVTLGTGTTPTPVLSQTTTKSWSTSQLLVPNDLVNGAYPSTNLTIAVKNGANVNATEMSLHDATAGTTPFDYLNITKITSITVPAGADATKTRVQLLDKTGAVLQDVTGSKSTPLGNIAVVAWAQGLDAASLADVYDIRVTVDGVFSPNVSLQVVLATQLRAATRMGNQPITAAAASGVNNTVTGVVSDGKTTISKDASAALTVIPAAAAPLGAALAKTFTPTSGTVYSPDPTRTVKLALGVKQTAGAPNVYVVTDTTPTFWNAFDFSGLSSITGTTSSPNQNYFVRIDYLVGGAFTSTGGALSAGTGTWKQGTEFALPSNTTALSTAQKALPAGVLPADVRGIRLTYTAKNGATWSNSSIGGFAGQQAIFDVVPRGTLRSGEPASDASSATSNPGEAVVGTVTNVVSGTVDDGLRPATGPIDITPVTKTFQFSAGSQTIVISKTPKSNAVVPGEEMPFKLTVQNTGTEPLVNPVFTDIVPWDAKGALLEYNPVTYTAASFDVTPATASITTDAKKITVTTTPGVVVAGKPTTQIAFAFPDDSVLLPGQTYVITLPMRVRAGVERNTVFDNTFQLTADGGYLATDTAQVTVLEGGSYGRIKDVKENVAAGDAPTGSYNTIDKSSNCVEDGGFTRVPCLVETRPGGTETWRLRVINTGNLPTTSMTMVDEFPKAGDTGTSKALSALSRGSLWTPIFLGDLDYSALPAGTGVTLWYQTAAQTPCVLGGTPASADPFGASCAPIQWIQSTSTDLSELPDPSVVTGIKVTFAFAAAAELQPGDQVQLTYQTQTPKKLPKGTPAYTGDGAPTPAWNSFVVFTTTDKSSGPEYDTLEPNKAGIAFATPVAVGDRVWIDANGNGVQDASEHPLAGVGVTLYDATNTVVGTTTTDTNGNYLFDNLYPGDYHAKFALTAAQQRLYRFTDEVVGDTATDSNADTSSGETDVFHLDAAAVSAPNMESDDDYKAATGVQIKALYIDPTIDAGVVPNRVSVGDYVWLDANKDGVQDKDETGIPGVVLTIAGPNGGVDNIYGNAVGSVVTDADGFYEFTDLPVLQPGESYTVSIDYLASALPLFSLFQSPEHGTTDAALDSSRDSAASGDLAVNGDRDETLDFGFYPVDLTTFPFDPQEPPTLAFTGIVAAPLISAGAAVLALGALLLLLPRKRRRGRHA